jgi:F-type H+/Na+-transporting ATPase subunit alpha
VEEQVLVIFAGSNGWVDYVAVAEVRRFESELLDFMRSIHPEILDHVRTTGALPDESDLKTALQAFKDTFVAMEGD